MTRKNKKKSVTKKDYSTNKHSQVEHSNQNKETSELGKSLEERMSKIEHADRAIVEPAKGTIDEIQDSNAVSKVGDAVDHHAITQDEAVTVGAQLKQLREEKDLSIEAFVSLTAFPLQRVQALENSEYSVIGSRTFVVGYIRRYAQWLGESPEFFLEQYKTESGITQSDSDVQILPSTPTEGFNIDPKIKQFGDASSSGTLFGFLFSLQTLLIVGVLVLFVAALSYLMRTPTPADKQNANIEVSLPVLDEKESFQNLDDDQNVLEKSIGSNIELTDNNAIEVVSVQKAISDGSPVSVQKKRVLKNSETRVLNGKNAVNLKLAGGVSVTKTQGVSATEDALQTSAPKTSDTLRILVTEDCWVEVKNNFGDTLHAKLLRAGSELVEQGQAPFSVMLGNARVASVSLNNEPVEITPRPGKNTLRLIVE